MADTTVKETLDEDDDKTPPKGDANAAPKDDKPYVKADAPPGEYVELSPEDARLSVEEYGADREAIRARRRAEKQYKKERSRRMQAAKDSEIVALRQENELIKQRLDGVSRHISSRDLSALDQRILDTRAKAKEAGRLMIEAIHQKHSEAGEEAMELRDLFTNEVRQLEQFKAHATRPVAPPPPAQAAPPDPVVTQNISAFVEGHDWYDPTPGTTDEDSLLTNAIDTAVRRAGFDPRTQDYWTELERRLQAKLPHHYDGADGADDDDDGLAPKRRTSSPASAQAAGPRGPQLGSGGRSNSSGGKLTVFVSADRKAAMIEAGHWDDPKKRASMLRRYAEHDKAHQQSR